MENEKIIALIYDFDKTLSTSDMQNFKFCADLGLTPQEFWEICDKYQKENHIERTLTFLYVMILECKKKGIKLTEEYLNSLGKFIEYYDGVEEWFDRINKYGKDRGVTVEHYIISSGNREIIKGTSIAKHFKKIFACNYFYDENGIAVWPRLVVNYTSKTQCLFRISKGVLDIREDDAVNAKVKHKRVHFSNMIYIGDGVTDVPCMTLIKERAGLSIAVYKKSSTTAERLYDDQRVDSSALADYTEGSKLDRIIKAKIDLLANIDRLSERYH